MTFQQFCRATYNAWGGFFDFIDRRQITRRVMFIWMMVITTKVVMWTTDFAWTSSRPGLEVAAIIAAVWAPMTALQGVVVKFYDTAQQYRDGKEGKRQGDTT